MIEIPFLNHFLFIFFWHSLYLQVLLDHIHTRSVSDTYSTVIKSKSRIEQRAMAIERGKKRKKNKTFVLVYVYWWIKKRFVGVSHARHLLSLDLFHKLFSSKFFLILWLFFLFASSCLCCCVFASKWRFKWKYCEIWNLSLQNCFCASLVYTIHKSSPVSQCRRIYNADGNKD